MLIYKYETVLLIESPITNYLLLSMLLMSNYANITMRFYFSRVRSINQTTRYKKATLNLTLFPGHNTGGDGRYDGHPQYGRSVSKMEVEHWYYTDFMWCCRKAEEGNAQWISSGRMWGQKSIRVSLYEYSVFISLAWQTSLLYLIGWYTWFGW